MSDWGNSTLRPMNRYTPKELRRSLIRQVWYQAGGFVPVNDKVIRELENRLERADETNR
jgi:hypothetical protein